MTFQTNCPIAKGRIDPVPMVSIVFLLLIFLVLTSPFVLQPGIRVVELPSSNQPPSASFQGVVVTVTRENLLFFNNQAVTLSALKTELRTATRLGRKPELIIKADRQVPHGTVVELMSAALEAGIPAVNIAVRPELPAAPR